MSFTHSINRVFSRTGETLGGANAQVAGAEANLDETIPPSSTDLAVAYAIAKAKVKSFYILADAACTIKTNSSSTPGVTFTVAADLPIAWQVTDPQTADAFFVADITSLFVTCSAGCTLKIRGLVDPT